QRHCKLSARPHPPPRVPAVGEPQRTVAAPTQDGRTTSVTFLREATGGVNFRRRFTVSSPALQSVFDRITTSLDLPKWYEYREETPSLRACSTAFSTTASSFASTARHYAAPPHSVAPIGAPIVHASERSKLSP